MLQAVEHKKGTLIHIPVNELFPHPDNPRKDLGDLTELSESIKTNGVMQNLTIVPRWREMTDEEYKSACTAYRENPTVESQKIVNRHKVNEGYTVVIGHRRLAAAKLAGLTELPCVIVEMSPQDQISTMLVENMQRTDLTVYEQAQGFQMMLDMGKKVEEIAEKSGFSESTIRRRVKLLELNEEKLKASEERGATLRDYMELDKIKDIERKNKVLDTIGTNNFQNTLLSAIEEEKFETKKKAWLEELKTFAVRIEEIDYQNMRFVENLSRYHSGAKIPKKPEDAGETKYFYYESSTSVSLYRENKVTVEEAEEERRREERRLVRNKKEEALQAITERHYFMRKEFIEYFNGAKKYAGIIMSYAASTLLLCSQFSRRPPIDEEVLADFLDIDYDTKNFRISNMDEFLEEFRTIPEYALLATAYTGTDSLKNKYWETRWTPDIPVVAHFDNNGLNRLYDFLTSIGYEMSDEERQMRDGTHPLFKDET